MFEIDDAIRTFFAQVVNDASPETTNLVGELFPIEQLGTEPELPLPTLTAWVGFEQLHDDLLLKALRHQEAVRAADVIRGVLETQPKKAVPHEFVAAQMAYAHAVVAVSSPASRQAQETMHLTIARAWLRRLRGLTAARRQPIHR